ncbi:MAG: WD40/YVTN/BNR-like repeat-containing protein, partial [Candidatus Kapaibacterium sp.]
SDTTLRLDSVQLRQHGIERTGGRTRSLVIDRTNENILLAGAVGGGVWRSTDAGENWKKTTADGYVHSVSALIQDTRPGHLHEWYYGTGEAFSSSGYPVYGWDIGSGIFRSIDSGKTWNMLPSTSVARAARPSSPFHFTHSLAIDATRKDSTVLYAACNGAIMRTNNAGATWSVVLGSASAVSNIVWTDVCTNSAGTVYATIGGGSSAGVWRSDDGMAFANISAGTSVGNISSRARICAAPGDTNTVWLYKNSSTSPLFRYTYISGTGAGSGGAWAGRNANMVNLLQTQSGYNMSLDVHPVDPDIVLVGGTNLYLTTDGFVTKGALSHVAGYSKQYVQQRQWNPFTPETYLYDTSHPDLHYAVFLPSKPQSVLIACDGGVFKTDDIFRTPSVAWSSLNNGYDVGQFYSVAIDPVGNRDGAFIGGAQDNNSNIGQRNGKPMEWVLGGDGMVCEMSRNHTAVYPSYQGGQVYRVRMNDGLDSALEWVNMRPRGGQFDFTTPLQLHPVHDSILYMIGGASLWRNTNATARAYTNDTTTSSVNWRSYPFTGVATSGLSAMGLCTATPDRVYLGTKGGVLLRVDSLQRSSPSTSVITAPDMPRGAYVSNICVDPLDNAELFVTFSNYEVLSIFHSTDEGRSWECIAGNLEQNADGSGAGPSCRWIEVLHYAGQTLYLVATSSGVFSTTRLDGMNTEWTQFRAIPNVMCNMIAARSTDGFIAVATHGLGIFTTYAMTGAPTSSVRDIHDGITRVSVSPQPVRSMARLCFTTTVDAMIHVDLFDLQGRPLGTAHRSWMAAGEQSVPLDVQELLTGTYVASIRCGPSRPPLTFRIIKE